MFQYQFAQSARMSAKSLRRARGLSQTELADMAGVEQSTISRIERAHESVTFGKMKAVAAALGVTVADLWTDDRSASEQAILKAFRALPVERQQGWLDLARTVLAEGQELQRNA